MSKKVTRLFTQFQPEHYQLELAPDRDAMSFTGAVTIRGKKVGRPSKRLTFHQKDLKITKAVVTKHDKKGDQVVEVVRINNQDSFDEVRLHSSGLLYPGEYTVTMEFEGKITRPMNGMYPCFFTHEGQERKLIATQFESHHAREAFPSIDEPEAKATFDLTLVSPAGETVIANTPVKTQKTSGTKHSTTFETTPKMSTYLLAFVFGELGHKEAKTKDSTVVRVYATPGNVQYTDFALDCAVKTLEFYNDYFDIPYPLEKCDFVALPDFASGAMENWGCITFREQALLVDPANTSLHLKQYVANVIAHELTHQWFGNLVTMRWWTDLWLNESFASWMSYLAVDHLFPDWKVWTQFIVDEQGLALKLDALEHTHPIEVEVKHPDEIRTIFDAISYEKGASVLHMLHHYLGADAFRDGLRVYLKGHAYSNTDTIDLWTAFEEVSKQPVKEFMSAWTSRPGYPIVTANLDESKLLIHQSRFYLNPAAERDDPGVTWPIPLLSNMPLSDAMSDQPSYKTPLPKANEPLLLNNERTGFYRVTYSPTHLNKLATAVMQGKLSELNRYGLLNDSFEAAKAGFSSSVDTLKLLAAYANEDSAIVWGAIADGMGNIRVVMDDDDLRAGLKPFVRQLTAEQLKRLGWEEATSDSHFDRLLRPMILGLASYGEQPSVVNEAWRQFKAMKKPEDIHPDIRGVVYGTVARTGGLEDFEKMLALHNTSTNSEERVTLASALTGFEQPVLIQRALGEITSSDVRLQDAPYWIAYSFMNRHARVATWQWLIKNWAWLLKNMGRDLSFSRMPIYAGRCFSDEAFLPEFTAFFESHMSPAFERPVKQAVETIELQAAWKKRDLAALTKHLSTKS